MSGMDRLIEEYVLPNAELEVYAYGGGQGPMAVMACELLAHRRASQTVPAPSDTDREWLIALLTHDQGELLDAYGVGAEVRQSDPELHGFAAAQADAILERLSQSSELAEIDAMLMDGQGDDDGPQILPDFEPGWSVAVKVEACLFLLEKRRDVIAGRASQAAPAHEDDLAVDRFAAVMKAKLAKKRNDGRGGWSGPECSEETLSRMLRDHVGKGDPVDVANFAMMLHQRGERIAQAAPAPSDDACPCCGGTGRYGDACVRAINGDAPAPSDGLREALERPDGAIHNGRCFMDRIEADYSFECIAGPISNCTDWHELRRCFEHMASYIAALTPAPAQEAMRPETLSEHIARDMREGRFPKRSEPQMVPAPAQEGGE